MDRDKLKAMLHSDEARRKFPYDDATGKTLAVGVKLRGKLTIGVGHNLTDKGLSAKAIDFLLNEDVDEVMREIELQLPWFDALSETRQLVVANMVFNLGMPGFLEFKRAIAAIAGGKYALAAEHMLESKWARQTGQRAVNLADMMRAG